MQVINPIAINRKGRFILEIVVTLLFDNNQFNDNENNHLFFIDNIDFKANYYEKYNNYVPLIRKLYGYVGKKSVKLLNHNIEVIFYFNYFFYLLFKKTLNLTIF